MFIHGSFIHDDKYSLRVVVPSNLICLKRVGNSEEREIISRERLKFELNHKANNDGKTGLILFAADCIQGSRFAVD